MAALQCYGPIVRFVKRGEVESVGGLTKYLLSLSRNSVVPKVF